MFDIKSFYEAKDVKDAVEALVREPEAEVISGGTDVLIRVREGKDAGRSWIYFCERQLGKLCCCLFVRNSLSF